MAQKPVQLIRGRTTDGETVNFIDLVPYLKDPEQVIFEGISPLELAAITAKTNFLFIVQGDIDMGRYQPYKDEPIPDFSKIAIRGDFIGSKYIKKLPLAVKKLDLSKCGKNFVTQYTIFPQIVIIINCAYCIQNLDILIGKIRETTEEIIVEPNLVKPSALMQNSDKMASAKKFAEMYPNIKIYDTSKKYELHAVLSDIAKQKTDIIEIEKAPEQKEEPETQKISDKIDGIHIDIKDIVNLCQKDPAFAEYSLTPDDLKRKIRFVLSNSPEMAKELMAREDGTHTNCVDYSLWPIIRQKMLDILDVKKAGDKVYETQKVNIPESKPETATIPNTDNTQKAKEPLDIQKYIPDSVIKQVKKSSGIDKLRNILLAINEINLDIADDVNYQGGVKIIKDGKITLSSNIKKENGCALVQSCDSDTHNDRKRLVWAFGDGPHGPVIVCQDFFEGHIETHRHRNAYNDCLKASSKRRSFSDEELEKYINVKDLIDIPKDDKILPVKIFINQKAKYK